MHNHFFVTGIGTDVGKTVVSAILTQAFGGAYWKPVQAGELDNSDRQKIEQVTKNLHFFPEAFRLSSAKSPHAAAKIDKVKIQTTDLQIPDFTGTLIIEGAGGLLVPFSNSLLIADWLEELKIPVIVVSRHYLGSINHSLLTLEVLKKRNIPVEGIIFVGEENTSTEEPILEFSKARCIARIPITEKVDQAFILEQANLLSKSPWFKSKAK